MIPSHSAASGPQTFAGGRILRAAIATHRAALARATGLMSLHQLCEVAVPVLIGVIVDRAIATTDVRALAAWIGVLAAVFVALTISYRFGARTAMRAAQDEAHRLRLRCADTILATAPDARRRAAGDVLAAANSDADEAGNLLRFIPQTGSAVTALLACAAALLWVDVLLGIIVLVGVPVTLSVVQLVAPMVTRRVAAQQDHIGHATAVASDLISGLRPLRGIRAESVAITRYRAINRDAREAMRRAAGAHGAFFGTATGVTGVLAVAVATLTGWFALTDRISIGALIAVLGLAQFLTEPLAILAMFPGRVATARASAERLAQILDDPARSAPAESQAPAAPVDEVDVPAGELVVFAAPGARSAQRAAERLIHTFAARRTPREVLFEPHRVDLFTGTVGSNLTLGGETVTADDALALLRAMGSEDVVGDALTGGDGDGDAAWAMRVSDRGQSLSGGQRQRLALCRALLTDPRVLILRDPTTAVDSITEATIARAVRDHRHRDGRDRTTVVITDSHAWRAVADRVIDGEGGPASDHPTTRTVPR